MSPQPAGVPCHLWQCLRLRGTICSGSASPARGTRGCGHRVRPRAARGSGRSGSPGPGPAAVPAAGDAGSSRLCFVLALPPTALLPEEAPGAGTGTAGTLLGGLRALGLLAHGGSALAPIFSGCEAPSCSPREELFLRAALALRLPRWGGSSRSWRPAAFSGGRSLVTASRAARENNSTSVRMLIHSTGSERWE